MFSSIEYNGYICNVVSFDGLSNGYIGIPNTKLEGVDVQETLHGLSKVQHFGNLIEPLSLERKTKIGEWNKDGYTWCRYIFTYADTKVNNSEIIGRLISTVEVLDHIFEDKNLEKSL